MAGFIRNVNWDLLRKQKETIVKLSMNNHRITKEEQDDLDGLTHFIDAVQDWAVDEQGVDESLVFPGINEEETE